MDSARIDSIIAAMGVALPLATASCAHGTGTGPEQSDDAARTGAPDERSPRVRTVPRDSDSAADRREESEHTPSERVYRPTPDGREWSVSELESRARARELSGRNYPFHDRPREVRGSVDCPDVELIDYRGKIIPYSRSIEINPRFRKRLVRFERIVRNVATEVYGRTPDRIVNFGGHSCRTVGRRGEKLSEHAFGHAIDVAGFDFDALSGTPNDGLATERAAEAFEVRLADHWDANGGFAAYHRQFLRRLAEVLQRRGPFSTLLGPAYPNHNDMFHFDFGPEFFFRIDRRP